MPREHIENAYHTIIFPYDLSIHECDQAPKLVNSGLREIKLLDEFHDYVIHLVYMILREKTSN